MKKLFLLRHASAPREKGESDRERKLSDEGIQEARRVGEYMLERSYIPVCVLSSDSPRTVDTFRYLNESLNAAAPVFTNSLYNVSSHQILEIINHSSDDISSLMIIGHNPSITGVLDLLNASCERKRLLQSRDYSVSGKLVVIESDSLNWGGIAKANNKIVDVYFP